MQLGREYTNIRYSTETTPPISVTDTIARSISTSGFPLSPSRSTTSLHTPIHNSKLSPGKSSLDAHLPRYDFFFFASEGFHEKEVK